MTDSEPSAIYSVLRGLDGVDEKTLKRPEVAYLSSVLEDGELPERVLDGQLSQFVVATDRRVIQVSTSILGKIKDASYPYHEISRVEGTFRMRTLNIHTTNKRMPIQINAPKDRVESFIAFVNPKIAEHREPDNVDALGSVPASLPEETVTDSETSPESAHPPPEDAVTGSEASPIYSVLRGLDGVDEKTLERPEVAYLSSVLENGEMPEFVLGSPPPQFVVATDRRIVHVSKAVLGDKIKNHAFYPYHDILQIEHSSSLHMHFLIIHTKEKQSTRVDAPKDRVEAFIAFVNPKIAEHRGPEPEIYSVLRGLGSVDEKELARPEVAYLPSILEDGEMPECVLVSLNEFVVATDRRIVHVSTSRSGDKIKKHASYPYPAISSVNIFSVLRMNSLSIHTQGKQINIAADRDEIESFIAFMNPKIAEHRGPEPEIYSVLRGLDGVDEKELARPEVAYLPSVLEDGEMPECVLISSREFVVATDKRIIYVNKKIGGKAQTHGSWSYRDDIYSVEHFSNLGMHSLIINLGSEGVSVDASKERIDAFIAFVNPKIEPKVTEFDLKMASIQEALRHLDGMERFGTRGEIKHLPSILWEDEVPLQITMGWYNGGNSLLVATDRRVILIDKGVITLKVEDFHYASITSVESRKGFGLGEMTIFVAGNKEQITQVPNDQVLVVADFIRNKVHELKTPSPPPPAPAPAPAPASIADELLKFSELLEKGLISQEEFDAQKAKLLGS